MTPMIPTPGDYRTADEMTGLVERLREEGLGFGIGPAMLCQEAADRITALEAQLQIVLDRESATTARYDAKLDALEAQVAAAGRLADAADRLRKSVQAMWLRSTGVPRDVHDACLPFDTALAAYRAAKGE